MESDNERRGAVTSVYIYLRQPQVSTSGILPAVAHHYHIHLTIRVRVSLGVIQLINHSDREAFRGG